MRAKRMRDILEEKLLPSLLVIDDESARHRGHAEAKIKGHDLRGPEHVSETHYKIEIISQKFDAMTRLERQRYVHNLLKEEFSSGLHALSLSLKSEKEA